MRLLVASAFLAASSWALLRADDQEAGGASWDASRVTVDRKFGGGSFGSVYSWPLAVKVMDLRNGADPADSVLTDATRLPFRDWNAKNEAEIHREAAEKSGLECLPHTAGYVDSWCESNVPQTFFPEDQRDTSPDEKTQAKLNKKAAERAAVRIARRKAAQKKKRAAKKIRRQQELDKLIVAKGWKRCKNEPDLHFDAATKAVFRVDFTYGLISQIPESSLEYQAPDLCVPKVAAPASDSPGAGSPTDTPPGTSTIVYTVQFRESMEEGDGSDLTSTTGARRVVFNSREEAEEAAVDLPHFAGLLHGESDPGDPARRKGKSSSDSSAQGTLQPGSSLPSPSGGGAVPRANAPCNYRLTLSEAVLFQASKVIGKEDKNVVEWLEDQSTSYAEEHALRRIGADASKAAEVATFLRMFWFMQVIYTDRWLHNHGVDHRDLNPGNILVAENWRCVPPGQDATCSAGVCYTMGPDTYCFTPAVGGVVPPALLRYSLRVVDYGIAWSRGSSSKPQDFKWSTAKTKIALEKKLGTTLPTHSRSWPHITENLVVWKSKHGWRDGVHGQLTDVAFNFKIADWKNVHSAPLTGIPRKDFNAAVAFERSTAFLGVIRTMFAKYLLKAGDKPPRKACHYSTD